MAGTESEQNTSANVVERVRKQVKPRVSQVPAEPAPIFGRPGESVVAFKLRRIEGGERQPCEVAKSEGGGVVAREARFAISSLTLANISETWGGGEYECLWIDNMGRAKGHGPIFRIEGPPKPLYSPPPSESPLPAAAPPAMAYGSATAPPAMPAMPLPPLDNPWASFAFIHNLYNADRDRERDRMREDRDRERERDREFYTVMTGHRQQRAESTELSTLRASIAQLEARLEEDEEDEEQPQGGGALATIPQSEVLEFMKLLIPLADKLGVIPLLKEQVLKNSPAIGRIVEGLIAGKGGT